MSKLTPSKLQAVRSLVESVPDETISGLSQALAASLPAGPLGAVRDMVREEGADRKVRNVVLAPVSGLCRGGRRVGRMKFSGRVMRHLWQGLKAESPALITEAEAALRRLDPEEAGGPGVLDELCALAGAGLRARVRPAFAAAAADCDAAVAAGADVMAGCLDLAAVVRAAQPQLEGWVGRPTDDRMVAARLAFRDAVAVSPDAGPRFIEMLASGLEEPWLSLRLVSMVMDRPVESFLAATEMAVFAEDVFADIDNLIATVRNFDPTAGVAAARKAGQAAHQATLAIGDFEDSVSLSRDGAWGTRLAGQRVTLAKTVEAKLEPLDRLVATALPLEMIRFAGRMTKPAPKMVADPDPDAVARAEAALSFSDEVRSAASFGGFGSARARALGDVNDRLTAYTDDLLSHLRSEDAGNLSRARRYLEVAASLLALSADERAAQIVRRRAAA